MKKAALLLTLVLSSLVGGCGGDGDSFVPDPEQLAAAQCSGTSLSYLDVVFAEVMDFLSSFGGTLPQGYDPATGDFTLTTALGTIEGNVSPVIVINDGLSAGESVTAAWDVNPGVAGVVGLTGSGVFDVSRPTTNTFTVTGNGQMTDTSCTILVPAIDLDIDLLSQLGPSGTLQFSASGAFGVLSGTMTFDGSSRARVVAALNGVPLPVFRIDLDTFQPIF